MKSIKKLKLTAWVPGPWQDYTPLHFSCCTALLIHDIFPVETGLSKTMTSYECVLCFWIAKLRPGKQKNLYKTYFTLLGWQWPDYKTLMLCSSRMSEEDVHFPCALTPHLESNCKGFGGVRNQPPPLKWAALRNATMPSTCLEFKCHLSVTPSKEQNLWYWNWNTGHVREYQELRGQTPFDRSVP